MSGDGQQPERPAVRCPEALRERFGLQECLGAGGMGAVYRGTLPGLGRPCAVKTLLQLDNDEFRKRFVKEGQVMARIRHPNLVELYQVGVEDGVPWIAMELVEGQDLQSVRERGPLTDPERLFRVLEGVGAALEALHREGIIHRDVKPANICLAPDGRPVLMDLGMAMDPDRTRMTATGAVPGTVPYMAPELLLQGRLLPAADWYALGVSLWEMMAGRRAYKVEQIWNMIGTGRWQELPTLTGPLAGSPLERTARALAAIDAAARPDSVRSLEGILFGARPPPPSPPPPSPPPEASSPPGADSGPLDPVDVSGPPSSTARRARLSWPVALAWVAVVGLLAGGWWARRAAPPAVAVATGAGEVAAPTPAPPSTAPPGARAPAAPGPEASEAEQLRWVCARLDLEAELDPWLILEAVFFGFDPELAARGLEALLDLPDGNVRRYFRVRVQERRGDFHRIRQLTRDLSYAKPPADYFEGRLRLKDLEARILLEGPSVLDGPTRVASSEARMEALRADIRALGGQLRASRELPFRVLEVELWDRLARRLHGRPRIDFDALEHADRLLADLMDQLPSTGGFLRAEMLLLAGRFAGLLGDLRRYRALMETYEASVLEPLEGLPAIQEYWTTRLREDGQQLVGGAGIELLGRHLATDPAPEWLPYPAGFPGSAPGKGPPLERPVVPTQPVARTLLEEGDGAPSRDALLEAARRARLRGGTLVVPDGWIRRLAAGGPEAVPEELVEELVCWPSASLALVDAWGEEGRGNAGLRLLRRAEVAWREVPGFVTRRRRWHDPEYMELQMRLLEHAVRRQRLEEVVRLAGRTIDALALHPPPWTFSELRGVARGWVVLGQELGTGGDCPAVRAEAVRLWLRALEQAVADRASWEREAGSDGDPAALLLDGLALWVGQPATPPAAREIARRALAALGEAFPEKARRLGRELARAPPSGEDEAAPCKLRGLPEAGRALPEARFPAPVLEPVERVRRVVEAILAARGR